MSAATLAAVLAGALLGAAGQLFLKAGAMRLGEISLRWVNVLPFIFALVREPRIAAGTLCYALAVGVWVVVLSRVDVSVAYPMVSLGYVVNAAAAHYLFGEKLNRTRVAGIAIILLGIYVLAQS